MKRDQRQITSLLGNLETQKTVIPPNCTQKISVVGEGQNETQPEISKMVSSEM